MAGSRRAKSFRELVLRAPRMYIGRDWDATGFHFLILEIIRLSIDPDTANECTILKVTVRDNGELLLEDNGRGLPVRRIRLWKDSQFVKPKIECVLTIPFERHPDKNYHKEFGFLNYLGAVLNAVSSRLEIETHINRNCYKLICSGGEIRRPLYKVGSSKRRGTRIKFKPDAEVFGDISFDNEILLSSLEKFSAQYPYVQLTFVDKRIKQTVVFS
jgi:DNA gyrase/topoisomerase IV subunit B